MSNQKKVAIGLSGGVDSSLSAVLLQEQGYEVHGVYLECWRAPGCRTEEDRKDALAVALQLGIPFQVLDFKEAYRQRVVEYFFAEYEAGRTPNPDVMCNKEIKFGLFYDWAMENGFDYVATGHYAQIVDRSQLKVERKEEKPADHPSLWEGTSGESQIREGKERVFHLLTSTDQKKDQTYFLYRLRSEQLAHILFPIGHLTKSEVREEAKKRNIPVANKPDSQGICFIGEINVYNFLRERLGEKPGEVINMQGEVIGKHQGLWFYTVGQRHGFEISGKWKSKQGEWRHAMPPYYVIKKIPETNQLVVGFGAETYRDSFKVADLHWIGQPSSSNNLFVRIRHGGKLIPCQIDEVSPLKLSVSLNDPTQGIAEGQSAVFYSPTEKEHEFVCLGGGVIV